MTDRPRREPSPDPARLADFELHRPLLFSIAYRMLGSVADAEDALQEAFIRWLRTAADEIRSPKALLITIVSRLCINHLESARVRLERPVGRWLPEPLLTEPGDDPLGVLRVDESLSMALMVLLERLTPVERAVFILREVFGFTYAEIARSLGHSETSCRQHFSRARRHIGDMRRRFETSSRAHRELVDSFLEAVRNGNVEMLMRLFERDVVLRAEGGAKAGSEPIRGVENVVHAILQVTKTLPSDIVVKPATINGEAGVLSYRDGRPVSAVVFDIANEHIVGVYVVAVPKKLAHLPSLEDAP